MTQKFDVQKHQNTPCARCGHPRKLHEEIRQYFKKNGIFEEHTFNVGICTVCFKQKGGCKAWVEPKKEGETHGK